MLGRDVGLGDAFPGLLSYSLMGKEGGSGGGGYDPGGEADNKDPRHTSQGWGQPPPTGTS